MIAEAAVTTGRVRSLILPDVALKNTQVSQL